jgi:iron-sulfur cluster assembly accessory protein
VNVSVESFDPNVNTVRVSAAAVEHFRRQLKLHPEARAVRLSVKESGCTGFMYVVDMVPDLSPEDLHLVLGGDVDFLIARNSLSIVSGTEIDMVTKGVNRQLSFLNPNAKDHCGCGESFSVV